MTEQIATGTFDIKLLPAGGVDAAVGSMSINKTFQGDLVATSIGQMLAVRSAVEGSAGYVAMERVTGALGGRQGSFALQHSGTMDRGVRALIISVVPDTGTEGLQGVSGMMSIDITDGVHHYTLRYALPT